MFFIDNHRSLYHNLNGFCQYKSLKYIIIIKGGNLLRPYKMFFLKKIFQLAASKDFQPYQDGKLE